MTPLQMSIITAASIGLACAALSVFVILRRWAFIGEGIAHAGFGGAGTAGVLMCVAVLGVMGLMRKEIVAFCFDAQMAETGGVRVGVIHYVMILLVTVTILLGMRLMGSLLVAALLILPGAIGLQISGKMSIVVAAAVAAGLIGAIAGPLINHQWPFV